MRGCSPALLRRRGFDLEILAARSGMTLNRLTALETTTTNPRRIRSGVRATSGETPQLVAIQQLPCSPVGEEDWDMRVLAQISAAIVLAWTAAPASAQSDDQNVEACVTAGDEAIAGSHRCD